MTPLKEAQLAPAIQLCLDAKEKAKADLAAALLAVQASCEHRIVAEMPYQSPNRNCERICLHCRLTERGSHWSGMGHFSREDYEPAILGDDEGRVVKDISRDEFYKLQVL